MSVVARRFTTAFNVASGGWTEYRVLSFCKRILTSEVNQLGSVDYFVSSIGVGVPAPDERAIPAGKEYEYKSERMLQPGDVPFFLRVASGSVSFDAEEQAN